MKNLYTALQFWITELNRRKFQLKSFRVYNLYCGQPLWLLILYAKKPSYTTVGVWWMEWGCWNFAGISEEPGTCIAWLTTLHHIPGDLFPCMVTATRNVFQSVLEIWWIRVFCLPVLKLAEGITPLVLRRYTVWIPDGILPQASFLWFTWCGRNLMRLNFF